MSKKYFLSLAVGVLAFAITTGAIRAYKAQPTCANSKSCITDLSEKIENNTTGIFQGKIVSVPQIDTTQEIASSFVLGADTTTGEKHIYIDLSKQTLYAYQGTKLVFKTLISSGKWGKTPAGNFNIWHKARATRMSGGSGADYYDLPNVPYVMYFYHDFGLHGAYWHNNFGHTMSHGCVNMRSVDAKTLFDWADAPTKDKKGTPVSVCNQLSKSNECIQDNPVQ